MTGNDLEPTRTMSESLTISGVNLVLAAPDDDESESIRFRLLPQRPFCPQ